MHAVSSHVAKTTVHRRMASSAEAVHTFKVWLADDSHDRLAQKVAGAAFTIRIVSAVLAYGSQIALARWMGTYEFGVFVYVWTWTLLIGGFADAGMAAAAQKFIPEYAERGALAHLRGFIVGSRWFAAGAATALALVAIAVVKLSEPILDTSAIVPLYIACFCLPIYALCSVQDGIARAYNSVGIGLMPTFIVRPLVLLALMAGAHFSGLGQRRDNRNHLLGRVGVAGRRRADAAAPAHAESRRCRLASAPTHCANGSACRCRSSW